jgi:hypothetical protein
VVVRRDHRDHAAAAVGLHLRRHGRRFRPAGCCWLVCAWHKRRRRRRLRCSLATWPYILYIRKEAPRQDGAGRDGVIKEEEGKRRGGRKQHRPPSTATGVGRGGGGQVVPPALRPRTQARRLPSKAKAALGW